MSERPNGFSFDYPKETRSPTSKYMQYLKKLNNVKKENQDLKEGLRNINKSLDRIIKGSKTPLRGRFASPDLVNGEEVNRNIEETQSLISKYKKDLSVLKTDKNSNEYKEKIKISVEVSGLKKLVQDLETENFKLKNKEKKIIQNLESPNTRTMIQGLKDRCKQLTDSIKEDEKLINQFRKQVFVEKKNYQAVDTVNDLELLIADLKIKVTDLETQKKREEHSWKQKISELRTTLKAKTEELLELENTFKVKDKNCRVKKIQIKTRQRENISSSPSKHFLSSEHLDDE